MIAGNSLFLDSGAHSLFNEKVKGKGYTDWSYYESDHFWNYVDDYCNFILTNQHMIEVYVSVDVIFNPELSWKVQQYMEKEYGLKPMPVFHSGEDFKWFKKYMDNYEYIGIGGPGQTTTKAHWARTIGDPIFSMICKPPHFLPSHKLHGFAITAPTLLTAYPWYSVDSSSWVQFGKYGMVVIPRSKNGKYNYRISPYTPFVSSRPIKKGNKNHFDHAVDIHQDYFNDYFAEKGFVMGRSEFKTVDPTGYKLQKDEYWANLRSNRKAGLVEIILERGLSNDHIHREKLNTQFYLDLEASIPPYPQPWLKLAKNNRLF